MLILNVYRVALVWTRSWLWKCYKFPSTWNLCHFAWRPVL